MDKNKITNMSSPEGGKSRIYTNSQAASGETSRVTAESKLCGFAASVVRLQQVNRGYLVVNRGWRSNSAGNRYGHGSFGIHRSA
jgi:hypothetical protein